MVEYFYRSSQNLNDSVDDRHYQNVAFHASQPHRSPHGAPGGPQVRDNGPHMRDNGPSYPRPASALLQRDDGGFRPDLYRPASQRDIRHQEPRLVHLPEEGSLAPGAQRYQPPTQSPGSATGHPSNGTGYPGNNTGYPGNNTGYPGKAMPPPTAPKPKDRTSQLIAYRIPEDGNGYRDSPPPPPPPTSTHPLLQGTTSSDTVTRPPFFSKTSAWEREEKERVSNY